MIASTTETAVALDHCALVTKKAASSFYYALKTFPRAERRALYAVYAFCRAADDISDEPGAPEEKAVAFARFRAALDEACAGRPRKGGDPLFVALADVVGRYGVAKGDLEAVVDGTQQDLDRTRYETFDELAGYLDRVAGAVGRITIRIAGLDPGRLRRYAESGGIAVQMTNIVRDVREDLERGRIYLPLEDLRRFGVEEADLGAKGPPKGAVRDLLAFEVARAREHYARCRAGASQAERRRLVPLEAIMRIYERLLDRIEALGYDVFAERVRVGGATKARLALGTWVRARLRLPLSP